MKTEKLLPRGIRKRNSSYVCVFTLKDGTLVRRTAEDAATAKQAQAQREIWMEQVRRNEYVPKQPRPKPAPTIKVSDLLEPYLRAYRLGVHRKSKRPGKDEKRLRIAWAHLEPMFADVSVSAVSTDLVQQYMEARTAAGASGGTVNREVSLLAAMFHRATRVTPPLVRAVPAFPSKLPESAPREGFINDKQYAVLAANAKEPWLRALIACGYSFGFRKGELLNLRVNAVDLLDRWIELRQGETKNGEARKVKLTEECARLLVPCISGKKESDFVFTRAGGQHVVDPRDEWYDLCVRSKLGELVPAKRANGEEYKRYVGLNLHDFRRSAIRNMTRRGVSQTVAMRISGHKTRSVFERYNIVDEADLEQATAKIEAGRQPETDTKTDTSGYAHA